MTLDAIAEEKSLAGKYLTFRLGDESYGVSVFQVREIIRLSEITMVPQMPDYVRGVINLRGKIIPVMDLRLKFGLVARATTERTCIVVVHIATERGVAMVGLIVDAIEDVSTFAQESIQPAPDFGTRVDTKYVMGIAESRERICTLIDVNCALVTEKLANF